MPHPKTTMNVSVGTNNKVDHQKFKEGQYTGPSINDFLNRARSVAAAFSYMMTMEGQGSELAKFLKHRLAVLEVNLKRFCTIDPNRIQASDAAYFKEMTQKATQLIQQFVADSIFAARDYSSEIDWKKELNNLAFAEGMVLATTGRSNLHYEYQCQSQNRFAISEAIGHTTDPSTLRHLGRLANFVEQKLGVVGEAKPEISFFRHSSYTPIKIKGSDSYTQCLRRAKAMQAAKQMITELARRELQKTDNPNDTIEVDLVSMLLLTPLKGDKNIVGFASGKLQVEESLWALRTFHGRELELDIDGKKVKVKATLSQMNMPANKFGQLYKIPGVEKSSYNNQGYYEHEKRIAKHVSEQLEKIPEVKRHMFGKYIKLFNEDSRIKALEAELQRVQETYKVSDLYTKLEEEQEKLLKEDGENKLKRDDLVMNYHEKLTKIKHAEKAINKVHAKLVKEQARIVKDNQRTLRWFKNFVQVELEYREPKEDYKNLLLLTQLHLDSQTIFHERLYRENQHGYQFQVRYLLANSLMGKNIETFCKSGEDRTGRCAEMLEEFLIYKNEKGYFPRFSDNTDNVLRSSIAQDVHAYSVNREITNQNAPGSKGLQGESSYGENAWLNISSFDRKLAKMAKGAYNLNLKGLQPEIRMNKSGRAIDETKSNVASSNDEIMDENDIEKLDTLLMNNDYENAILDDFKKVSFHDKVIHSLGPSQTKFLAITSEKSRIRDFFGKLTDNQMVLQERLPGYLFSTAKHITKARDFVEQLEKSLKEDRHVLFPNLASAEFQEHYERLTQDSDFLEPRLARREHLQSFLTEKLLYLKEVLKDLQQAEVQHATLKSWFLDKTLNQKGSSLNINSELAKIKTFLEQKPLEAENCDHRKLAAKTEAYLNQCQQWLYLLFPDKNKAMTDNLIKLTGHLKTLKSEVNDVLFSAFKDQHQHQLNLSEPANETFSTQPAAALFSQSRDRIKAAVFESSVPEHESVPRLSLR